VSFIVCSSDQDDLLAVCDRVLVLSEGELAEELTGTDIEESRLLTAMMGGIVKTTATAATAAEAKE
jgi:ABC-type sugar transport system ATPase subunit